MKFINRFVVRYTAVLVILTGIYCVVLSRPSYNGQVYMPVALVYVALVFASALIFSVKDRESGYAGFNYHLLTYIVVIGTMACLILLSKSVYRRENIQTLLFTMGMWGIGLLFHLASYFLFFRKKQIRNYNRDEIFN